ncbi:hypothetical protein L208DRAFT_1422837 [Tricholoma matsutake]|nr:hypothetical protein L208DRAFT_1422837 [Tricholoma matsutake 945]
MSSSPSPPGIPSGAPPILPAFDNTLGALLLGGMIAMALWGITCVQTYTFFTQSHRDTGLQKLTVAFLCALDTFDSALNVHILYFYMVTNYLNPMALLKPVWCSVSNFFIRTLFAQRVYKLSQGNILVTAWIVSSHFGLTSYLELDKLADLMYLIFAAGTLSDLSVAVALCVLLFKARTGFRKTDTLIKILVTYTVNTGLIVAVDASLGMIMYIVMPHNFVFLTFYLLLSKLYLNSYLATMNAREDLRDRIDGPVSIHLSQISSKHRYNTSSPLPTHNEKRDTEAMAISVETVVEEGDNQNARAY